MIVAYLDTLYSSERSNNKRVRIRIQVPLSALYS